MKEVDLHEILHVYGEQRQQDVERRQGENRLGGILRNVRRPRINWKGVANVRRPRIRGKRRPRSSSFFCFQSCYIGENVDPEVAPSSASSLVYSFSVSLDLERDLYLKRKIQGGGGELAGHQIILGRLGLN